MASFQLGTNTLKIPNASRSTAGGVPMLYTQAAKAVFRGSFLNWILAMRVVCANGMILETKSCRL